VKRSVEYKHEVLASEGRRDIVAVLMAQGGKVRLCRGTERLEMSRGDARKLAGELLDFVDSTADAEEAFAPFIARPEE